METSHRIKVKIGDAEFEAEGDAALVKQQYSDFLAALAHKPASAPADKPRNPTPPGGTDISDDDLTKVFKAENNRVSLLMLPQSDNSSADALLMLIYGYTRLLNKQGMGAAELALTARASGITGIERMSRVIEGRKGWFHFRGARKAREYLLTNLGKREIERVIRTVLDS